LAEGLDRILTSLGQREVEFLRVERLLDDAEKVSVSAFLTAMRAGVDNEFESRKKRVLEEFDKSRGTFTDLADTGRQAWLGIKQLIATTKVYEVDESDREKGEKLEGRLLRRHFGKDDLEQSCKVVIESATEQFRAQWKRTSDSVRQRLERIGASDVANVYRDGVRVELAPDGSTLVGGGLLGSTAIATAALAAGWHTIGYALAHLFWPAALVSALAYAGYAVFKHEDEKARQGKDLDKQLSEVKTTALRIVEADVARVVREDAARIRSEMKATVAAQVLGGVPADFREFVELIERARKRVGISPGGSTPTPTTLLEEGHRRLAAGDLGSAVLLGGAALEGIVEGRFRRHFGRGAEEQRLPMYEAIEVLKARRAYAPAECDRLHRARMERNSLVHDAEVLRTLNPARTSAFLTMVGELHSEGPGVTWSANNR
jgi:hypothetical protein